MSNFKEWSEGFVVRKDFESERKPHRASILGNPWVRSIIYSSLATNAIGTK
jgi:hypothetical protein